MCGPPFGPKFASRDVSARPMSPHVASQIRSQSPEIKGRCSSFGALIRTNSRHVHASAQNMKQQLENAQPAPTKTPPPLAPWISLAYFVPKVKFKCAPNCSSERSNGRDTTWQPAPSFLSGSQRRREASFQNVKGSDSKLRVLPPPARRTLGRTPEASL